LWATYLDIVDVHDLIVKDVFDDDGLNFGDSHTHGLLLAGFFLLSVGLLNF
jgi:hypothetical protein